MSFSVLVFSLFIHFTTQLTDNTSYFKSTWIKMCYSHPFLLWNAVEITLWLLWSSLTFRIFEKWRKRCCMKPTETYWNSAGIFSFLTSGLITATPLSSFNFFFSIIFEANPLLSLLKLTLVSSNLFCKYLVLYCLKSPLCFLLTIYLVQHKAAVYSDFWLMTPKATLWDGTEVAGWTVKQYAEPHP